MGKFDMETRAISGKDDKFVWYFSQMIVESITLRYGQNFLLVLVILVTKFLSDIVGKW